ncbi:chemotaxis protein CheW, partial [Limnobacter sp.]|uniref:chemotaxis protein CheW n=1 Tax=Limnobacter sp. TaxID=2003368 RepID=UPI003515A67A
KHINDLYTVYTNVLLVDVQGKVVCSSQPCHGVDKLDTPWLAQALRLNDKQHYAVSPFEESPLYAGRPTYLYCAPVLKNDASHTKALGAVVLVFDAEPQFEAILRESMAGHHAAMAYIVDEEGNVISSTSNRFIHNGQLKLPLHFTTPFQKQSHWHQVLSMDGVVYAVGCCNSANYREYKSEQDCYQNNLTGVYLMDMGVEVQPQKTKPLCFEHLRSSEATKHSNLEVATFRVGSQWYGVDTAQVQESFVAKHLATMPNAQPCVLGSTLHKGRAVTVLDLAVLMDQTEQYQQSDARQEPIQLVLLKSSEDGMTLALRADALGEIPNIPVEEIQPTEQLLGKNPLLAGLVKTPSNLLLLLEPGKLMDQLRGKEKGLFWEEAFDGARDLEKAINAHSRVSHCEALPR